MLPHGLCSVTVVYMLGSKYSLQIIPHGHPHSVFDSIIFRISLPSIFCVCFFPSLLSVPLHFFPPKAECGLESWVEGRDHSLCPSSKAGAAEHQGQVAPASPGQHQGHLESHARLPSPFRPLSLLPSPPEPNANLIYDVCTEEMTLGRPFKSSCHCRSPWPGSLLISIPFLLKLKAFFQLGNSC